MTVLLGISPNFIVIFINKNTHLCQKLNLLLIEMVSTYFRHRYKMSALAKSTNTKRKEERYCIFLNSGKVILQPRPVNASAISKAMNYARCSYLQSHHSSFPRSSSRNAADPTRSPTRGHFSFGQSVTAGLLPRSLSTTKFKVLNSWPLKLGLSPLCTFLA